MTPPVPPHPEDEPDHTATRDPGRDARDRVPAPAYNDPALAIFAGVDLTAGLWETATG